MRVHFSCPQFTERAHRLIAATAGVRKDPTLLQPSAAIKAVHISVYESSSLSSYLIHYPYWPVCGSPVNVI